MTTFTDGTVVEIGTPRPTVTSLPTPSGPSVSVVPVPGPQGDQGEQGEPGAVAVSTDASFSLPAPTGTGLEFVIVADELDDIRWNGASL